MNQEQKQSVEKFVDDVLDRRDLDLSQRVDRVLNYAENKIGNVAKRIEELGDDYDPRHAFFRLNAAEYACNFMKQRLAVASVRYLQRKLDAEIAKITAEKQKLHDLLESPGTSKFIPEIMKATSEEHYELAAILDGERCLRVNFLTTAQFGQRLPEWPTEARKDPDNVRPEYKHLFQ